MKQITKLLGILLSTLAITAYGALPDTSVSYTTSGEPFFITVRTLEKTLGTSIEVRDLNPDTIISGKYLAPTGKAFMDDFAKRNKLAWIYENNRIVIAPEGTDLSVKPSVNSGSASPSSFSRIVFDPKDPNKLGLMIFQVQNASVDDRRIPSGGNNQPKVIKGVATLFAEFIGAPPIPDPLAKKTPDQNSVKQVPKSSALQNGLLGLFTQNAPKVEDPSTPNFIGDLNTRGVYSDTRQNAVLVRDKVANFESYKQIITFLDRPADMVQLEAFIVDVRKEKFSELGLDLGLGGKGSLGSNLILNPFSGRSLLSQIKALETSGNSETLSVPSIVSLNNEQALFSSRQNFFIKVAGAYDTSVQQVTAETQLLVTPQIANDSPDIPYNQRRVRLLVNVQDAQAGQTGDTVAVNTTENQVNTQAVVRSGDTLVIGGQIVRKRANGGSGLPTTTESKGFFSRLFSTQSELTQDYIRIYMVRPLILGEDSASARQIKGQ